eukprot:COSAG04_NODE_3353_length_2891_cov_2.148108_1_plen_78_part_10
MVHRAVRAAVAVLRHELADLVDQRRVGDELAVVLVRHSHHTPAPEVVQIRHDLGAGIALLGPLLRQLLAVDRHLVDIA